MFNDLMMIIAIHREIQVQLVPRERLALSALRVYQANQEQRVSEDSQDQW